MGIVLDRKPHFKAANILVCTATPAFMAISFITLPSGNVPLYAVNTALIGFFAIPITPLCFAFTVELSYPVHESISNGMLILPSKIFGALMSILSSVLANIAPVNAIMLFCINVAIAVVCSLFVVEDLRRLRPKKSEILIKE